MRRGHLSIMAVELAPFLMTRRDGIAELNMRQLGALFRYRICRAVLGAQLQ